jgi:outer membrane protein
LIFYIRLYLTVLIVCILPSVAVADGVSLTLPAAITEALRTQPQVFQSAHTAAAGRDRSQAAHAVLLPQISLAAGSSWSESRNGQPLSVAANGPREVIGQIQVSVPLYAPQLHALAKAAKDQSAINRSQETETILRVAAQVVNAYYQLDLLQTQTTIWRSTLNVAQKLYLDTHKAYAAGAVSQLDLAQTALLRNKARAGLQQTAAETRAATRLLNLQLGRAPDGEIMLSNGQEFASPLLSPSLLDTQAKHMQPLVQVADRQIALGRAQIHVTARCHTADYQRRCCLWRGHSHLYGCLHVCKMILMSGMLRSGCCLISGL